VALDKSVDVVTAEPTALVALDGSSVELAGDVAECDRSVAGHYSQREAVRRKARLHVKAPRRLIAIAEQAIEMAPPPVKGGAV